VFVRRESIRCASRFSCHAVDQRPTVPVSCANAHIASLPTSQRPAEGLFERSPRRAALVRHAWGHSTHFHVRFSDPDADELGRRLSPPSGSPKKRSPR